MGRGLSLPSSEEASGECPKLTYSTCPVSWRRSSLSACSGEARLLQSPELSILNSERVVGRRQKRVACTKPEGPLLVKTGLQ